MVRIHKQPPKQNLALLPVLIEDETTFSDYFEINELNRIFHAGRNGFLIRGTDFLRIGSNIAVEVVDRFGNPVFATPVANYSEGGSRLVSVEIYQTTARGPGRLIVVGEATQYADGRPIPAEWRGRTNLRWSVPIQIEPRNENRTKIRLSNDPEVDVSEQNFDITRVDTENITISNYTASLTYDYEVEESDGYAIEMLDSNGSPANFFDEINESGSFTGSLYRRVVSKLYDNGVVVPSSESIVDPYRTASVSLSLDKVLNESDAITLDVIQFNGEDFPTTNLISGSFEYVIQTSNLGNNLVRKQVQEYTSSVTFDYVERTVTTTASTSSIVNFRIPFVQTYTGEIAQVKITAKEANDNISAYQPFAEFFPAEKNILITTSSIGNIGIGDFSDNNTLQDNWHAGRFLVNSTFNRDDYEATSSVNYPLALLTSSTNILEGAVVDNTQSSDSYFFGTTDPFQLYEAVEYTLKYTAVYSPTYESGSTTYNTNQRGDLDVYLARTGADSASRAESAVISTTDAPYGLLVDEITTKQVDKSLYEREINFRVLKTGLAHLRFVSNEGFWSFGEIEVTPSIERGFNPDEIVFEAENNVLVNSTNVFKIQFLNWNDEPIDYQLITSPIFISGARDPGIDGFTISLSNEAHVFPSDSTGSITSYQGGGTDIEVFNGNTPLDATLSTPSDGFFSASVVSASNITPNQPPSANGSVLTYGDPSGMPDSVNSASITYKITSKFANRLYTFIKRQNFSKAIGGVDGISPIAFSLAPTSQTVAAGTDGSVPGGFQDVIISGSQGLVPLVYNQSPTLLDGEFKITNVSGSVTVADSTPATPLVQITAASQDTNFVTVSIEYKSFQGNSGTTTLYFTVTKSIEGADGDPGTSGQDGTIFYIKPLNGRSFRTDPETEVVVPTSLQFQTLQNIGGQTQSIASSSAYGLFYSSSGDPVSQSTTPSTYRVEPVNVLGHDSLEFRSASTVLDTIDVTDITDGYSAIYPLLKIDGALTFISGSDGIIRPNIPTKITGSVYHGPDIVGTAHAEIGPVDNVEITGSLISSSTQISSSFETFVEGSSVRNVNFLLFSGSGGAAEQIGKETFYLIKDGQAGISGSNGISVFASPSSQFVSESTGGNFATPKNFNIVVTERATQYSYDAGLSSNSSFSHSIVQSGSSPAGGTITPDPITSTGQYEVHVNVFYRTSEGTTTTNPIPVTHSMVTSRDGSDGPAGRDAVNVFITPASQVVSQSTDGSIDTPVDFRVVTTQGSDIFSYDAALDNPGEFSVNVTQNGTNLGNGFVSPDTLPSPGQYEVHVEVSYLDNYGSSSASPWPVTHSISTALDGQSGPGVVFTGTWTGSRTYQYSTGVDGRRDAVLWSGSSGDIDSYYATLQQHSGQEPLAGSDSSYWEFLGTEDYFVAAKIGIFEESFIENTLNIGANSRNGVSSSNITLQGATVYPYLSIGQANTTGQQGYGIAGIFLGREQSPPGYKFSVSGSGGGLFFDGSDLTISGSLDAQGGRFSGIVNVGDRVKIGPGATPEAASITSVSGFPDSSSADLEFVDGQPGGSGPQAIHYFSGSAPVPVWNFTPIDDQLYEIDVSADEFRNAWYFQDAGGGNENGPFTLDQLSMRITSMRVRIEQGGSLVKTDTVSSATDIDVGTNLFKSTYYTANGTDPIDVYLVYTGSFNPYGETFDGPGGVLDSSLTFFSASADISTLVSTLSINGSGLFVDQGNGSVNVIELINSGSDTTGGTFTTPSLTQVVAAGSDSSLPIQISDDTTSTTSGTGALVVTGGVGIGGDIHAASIDVSGQVSGDSGNITNTISAGTFSGGSFSGTSLSVSGQVSGNSGNITNTISAGTFSGGSFSGTSISLSGNGTASDWIASSDIRLKNVIGPSRYGLNEIMKMSPIVYYWKDKNEDSRRHVGLSAQEIKEIVPEAVYGSEEDYYKISYNSLIPVLINAIKELKSEVNQLRNMVSPYG